MSDRHIQQYGAAVFRQRGAVLAISLLMLLVLTLIGVTAMQTTTLEERMAGNTRDRELAFQAAEAGLRDAEDFIDNGVASAAAFNGANGLYGEANTEPDFRDSATWNGTNSRAYTSAAIDGIATQPRYFIKLVATINPSTGDSLKQGGYGANTAGNATIFRITVRGTGGSDNAQVFLRSRYGRRF
ncbi:MAG: pilus assembly protein PilX [Gammaproteobacteria bacterium]|nr:pilus assembly protein PilX [Gammaproteobacteria bacterium]NIR98049.1 pilus assembly protein PilX [Gammaproteobacteria bacterium]NIT63759.1 pilus assembly protein PilX [Gammaproteobacteria bacterium]NIV20709.1 pilus assembly protein PilX [Gammaproteobacteria bacterium]NIY32339.1 pilus assembly protein PilX [Gammaproteobacteria bacterium]